MGSLIESRRRIIMNSPHITTSSGSIANFSTDLASPLKSCKVSFSPVQEGEGDPSPTNVRNITGWTGLDVTRSGKNLIPSNVQVLEGKDTNTDYKIPLAQMTISSDWSSTGTVYGGWVDLVSGELWKTYEKITCDGTGQWSVNNYSTYNRVVKAYGNLSTGKPKNNGNVIFNYIKSSGNQTASWNGFIGSTGNILAYVPIEYNTSVIWKNYLSDNPLNICYELETPILVTTLSPQQLKTLKGTNNIWSDANGDISVKYWTH